MRVHRNAKTTPLMRQLIVTRAQQGWTYAQSHEVPNLFVVDGSAFPSFPENNPTLTIMALSMRAGRHIVEAPRRGDL